MIERRREAMARRALALAFICCSVFASMLVAAQEAGQPEKVDAKYDEQLIEEIVVRGQAWRLPENDEREWRRVEPTIDAPRVRMSLGYDVERERELRVDSAMPDINRRTPEPATVIRFRF
jgi:hypothetical protein